MISRMDISSQDVAGDRMLTGFLQELSSMKAVCRLIKLLCNQTWCFPHTVLASDSCRALRASAISRVSAYSDATI